MDDQIKMKLSFSETSAVFIALGIIFFNIFAANATDIRPGLQTVIAFVADIDSEKPQPLWKTLWKSDPDIVLFLGDNIYGDTSDEIILRKKYDRFAENPEFKTLLEKQIPFIATWDDHDYGEDDAGADFSGKRMSQKIFTEFWRKSPPKHEGIYDSEIFGPVGKQIQIIILDTRYFRSPLKKTPDGKGYMPDISPNAAMLGEAQWEWLENELKKPAEVRIIMSSIQLASTSHPYEKWANFPRERDRLFRLIRETEANGVIFVSGDRHFGELSKLDGVAEYPIYDITTGSFNRAVKTQPGEANRYRSQFVETQESFGLITIDWAYRGQPQITLDIKNIFGQSSIKHTFPLKELYPS